MSAVSVGHTLADCPLPPAEARALLAVASGVPRETLIAFPEREVSAAALAQFAALAARRRAGEPLAYLLGTQEFYGRGFAVTRDVLIPRPETELLIDLALPLLRGARAPRVLDLGTGSGCIAVTLALEASAAEVTAVDASAAALAVARANADRLGARVAFVRSDWFDTVTGSFDLIVSNPPYIAAGDPHLGALRFEPTAALTAGADGLACLRRIAQAAPAFLARQGTLMVERGYDQGEAVRRLFAESGFADIHTHRDLAGHERVCVGRLPGAG